MAEEETTETSEDEETVEETPEETKVTAEDDWKAKARKHERALKAERKTREEFERRLKEREDADKSETEKAIEKARQEARQEALSEAEKERRQDRLELAVTRLAAKGITVGEGDEAKRFADPEDALDLVTARIARNALDPDSLYEEDGQVDQDALKDILGEIAAAKPGLLADGPVVRPKGGAADAGKGQASKDLEAMSPSDHEKRKYGDGGSTVVQPAVTGRR